MDMWFTAGVPFILALLLAALILALIFSKEFRRAVLSGRGEAKVLDLVSIKGVAIVLLVGLLLGGILFTSRRTASSGAQQGPISMRLNVHFSPDEVNPRNPKFSAKAFLKKVDGIEELHMRSKVSEGALSIEISVPDMDTPFFVVFETPQGTWKTDDYSVREAVATALKQTSE